MESSKMTNIPSEEDFANAKKYMRERYRNIDKIEKNFLQYFKEICPTKYHKVYIFVEEEKQFRTFIFFKKDEDVKESEKNGIQQNLIDFIYSELERQGRGKKTELKVIPEFDSDESVDRNFDGDYYSRLH